MNISPRFVRVSFLATLLLASLAPTPATGQTLDEQEEAHFVGWTPGDSWEWRKDPTNAEGSRSRGTLVWKAGEIGMTEPRFWQPSDPPAWKSQETIRVQTWLNTTLPTEETTIFINQAIDVQRRVDDLAIVQSFVDDRYDIRLKNGTSQGSHTERDVERFSPLVELRFPFAVGDQWRARAEQRHERVNSDDCGGQGQPSCRGQAVVAFTYWVVGREVMTLPIGGEERSFDTWRIKVSDEATTDGTYDPRYEIWWYADEACNVIKREQYSGGRTKLGVFTLTDFSCARGAEQDPDYAIYGPADLSTTRDGGTLNDAVLAEVRLDPSGRRSTLWAPGLGPAGLLAAIGAALLVSRRRDE